MTIGELSSTISQINFPEMFNAHLTSLFRWTNDDLVAIEVHIHISLKNPIQNMEYLLQLVQILSVTTPRALANYLVSITALNLRRYSYDPRTQFRYQKSRFLLAIASL